MTPERPAAASRCGNNGPSCRRDDCPWPEGRCVERDAATSTGAWPRGHAFGIGLLDDGSYRIWLPTRLVLGWHTLTRKPWRPHHRRLAKPRALYWQLLRGHTTEICQRCGGPVRVVFRVPDDIWTLATGATRFPDGESAPGVLCPPCVDDLVEPKVDGYLTWTCAVTR